jgi:hypothetical protein
LKRALELFNHSLEIAPGNDYIRNLRDQLIWNSLDKVCMTCLTAKWWDLALQ